MIFLYVKAFHMMAVVAWFAALFYLPRLFVYHAEAMDPISIGRFQLMEKRLYLGIACPAGCLTVFFGVWLIITNPAYYLHAGWMHAKFALVMMLIVYHFSCGYFLKQFQRGSQKRGSRFFRIYNEVPTLMLVGIVLLVTVKPF